jgi:hypothetical protein
MRVGVQNSSLAGKPWTANEDDTLVQQHLRGMTLGEIARVHQRTEGAIESRLNKLQLLPAASRSKVEPLARSGSVWDADEDRRLIHAAHRFLRDEISWQQIVDEHQRTSNALERRVVKLNYLLPTEQARLLAKIAESGS